MIDFIGSLKVYLAVVLSLLKCLYLLILLWKKYLMRMKETYKNIRNFNRWLKDHEYTMLNIFKFGTVLVVDGVEWVLTNYRVCST